MTGPCRNARRCVQFNQVDGPAFVYDTGPLCSGCLGRAAADVRALAADHAALTAELTPAGGVGDGKVSGGDPEAPVPLALAVEALQRDIVWTLTVWEPPVREAAGLPDAGPGRVRDAWAVSRAVALIAERVAVLAALGPTWGYADGLDAGPVEHDGVYALAQLGRLHAAAQRLSGDVRLTRSLPGPCPACGGEALLRDDGSDAVRCGLCEGRWTVDDYRRHVSLILAGPEIGTCPPNTDAPARRRQRRQIAAQAVDVAE